MCVFVCVCVCVHKYIHSCKHTYTHTHKHAQRCVCVCVRAHARAHTHTHTQICLIIDESHELFNDKLKDRDEIYKLVSGAQRVFLLSGTSPADSK